MMSPARKSPRARPKKPTAPAPPAPFGPHSAWETDGSVGPLGATWLPELTAWNFALYARHATAVSLQLYGEDPATPITELALAWRANRTGRVWHRRVRADAVPGARYYAYRVDGPE